MNRRPRPGLPEFVEGLPSCSSPPQKKERASTSSTKPVAGRVLVFLIRLWQRGPSLVLPPTCRYAPSCSAYAVSAIERHGASRGGWLALKRILRCHPGGGSGYDPVP